MESYYLVRYGLGRQVGRFAADSPDFARGQTVVIRSHRGTELGEVLLKVEEGPAGPAETRVLRAAGTDDLERARRLERERAPRFDACLGVLRGRDEGLELIDVEPLLDDRRVVLHYLGPHRLEAAGLLAAFRSSCDIDVFFEPAGRDVDDEPERDPDHDHGCGHCGADGGGCGAGGGCGTGGGCADCGVKRLLDARRR